MYTCIKLAMEIQINKDNAIPNEALDYTIEN